MGEGFGFALVCVAKCAETIFFVCFFSLLFCSFFPFPPFFFGEDSFGEDESWFMVGKEEKEGKEGGDTKGYLFV